MAVRIVDVALAVSLCAAGVAGTRWATGPSEAKRRGPPGSVTVEKYVPDYAPCDIDAAREAGTGHVRFALEPGESFVGLTSAKVYPILDGRLVVEKWDDVVTAHVESGLDLAQWLARRQPSGPHALLFGLVLDGPEGRQYRVGWARFEASDLQYSSLRVRPRGDHRCVVAVATASGQNAPGALVSFAPPLHQNGLVTALVTTGADGTCVVTGLGAQDWVASLPQGLGPDHTHPSVRVSPTAETATIVSPLRGKWKFVESLVDVPFHGGSLLVADVKADGGAPGAWPVSPFVAPGPGRRRPWTWMSPDTEEERACPVVLAFNGMTPLRVEDAARPFTVHPTRDGLAVSAGIAGR